MNKKKRIKVKLILICALLIALTSALYTAAWYVISGDRTIESSRTDVMMPYFLYLLNPGDEKSLSVSIGNIHIPVLTQIGHLTLFEFCFDFCHPDSIHQIPVVWQLLLSANHPDNSRIIIWLLTIWLSVVCLCRYCIENRWPDGFVAIVFCQYGIWSKME